MDELLTVVTVRLDHPDVVTMIDEVQQEYVRRYGGPDETPLTPDEFVPPAGNMFLARLGDVPVGMGGWRTHDHETEGLSPGDAEIKRMYVRPTVQRRGIGRRLLAEIESSVRSAGRTRLVLETGSRQPEAIEMYRSSGFVDLVPKFGLYRHEESSVSMMKRLDRLKS